MTSQLDVRPGVQVPQVLLLPMDVASLESAELAIELADSYGLCDGHPLDESQRVTLRAGLGERADGSWAATQVADFKGRQGGGKSDAIAARELAGLILFEEELIIHTAHEFPTANESFLRLVALFENWDDLRKKVRRILYGNGTQSINLLSGQRILYKARTAGAGRGFTKAALVVYDEAQHLQSEHVAASGPTRLAHPNSQSWYAGSGGLATSGMAWRLRRRALEGVPGRLAYCEGTAQELSLVDGRVVASVPDAADRSLWGMANPGLGRWVTEESLAGLYDELGPELFARECMCVWDPEPGGAADQIIPSDLWAGCGVDGLTPPTGVLAYAVDVAPDQKWASVAVSDGRSVLVTDHAPGVDWVPGVLEELTGAHPGPVFLDPRGEANALVTALPDARSVKAGEHAQACGELLAAVLAGKVTHGRQPVLDAAVAGATRRPLGDAWAWNRRTSSVDISPLVAVTLARWGALQLVPVEAGFVDLNDFLDGE